MKSCDPELLDTFFFRWNAGKASKKDEKNDVSAPPSMFDVTCRQKFDNDSQGLTRVAVGQNIPIGLSTLESEI